MTSGPPHAVNIYEPLYRTFRRLLRAAAPFRAQIIMLECGHITAVLGTPRYFMLPPASRGCFSKIGRDSAVYTEPVIYVRYLNRIKTTRMAADTIAKRNETGTLLENNDIEPDVSVSKP